MSQEATTGVGRMMWGSLYNKQTTDNKNKPIPEDKQRYSFGVAFPKTGVPGQHWAHIDYLAPIYNESYVAFQNKEQERPSFSWKIVDGDSTVPNDNGNRPCDQEGYPGHFIVTFSTMLPIGAWERNKATGSLEQLNPLSKKIEPGDYVQVHYTTTGNNVNGPAQTNGMYVNPANVALIEKGVPLSGSATPPPPSSGFGAGALPPDAQIAKNTPALPPTGGTGNPPPPNNTAGTAGAPPNPTVHVAANHAGLNNPNDAGGAGAPAAPNATSPSSPPPPPAGPVLTPAGVQAGGTLEAFRTQGWTDEQLKAAGYI